jgi:biopolymer transport protein ExbB
MFHRRIEVLLGCWLLTASPAVVWAQGTPEASTADGGFWSVVFSGGPFGIGIMLVLIAMSILTVYLIVDQSLLLRRSQLLPKSFAEEVRQMLLAGKWKEAEALCRERPSPLGWVLHSGLGEAEFGWPAVEKAMEETLAEQAARLFRRVEYLSVIGNLAPMLGLLGTVAGMIIAFRQVAISQGSAGAGDLASGIYSALVTTVAGLLIAIPALGALAIFRNRIDQLMAESAYVAQQVIAPLRRRLLASFRSPIPGASGSGRGVGGGGN